MSNSGLPALSALPATDRADVTVRLRDALLGASFTADGLLELLGAPAYAALARSETVPALRATRGDTPLETLVRLFLLQQPVLHARVADVLPVAECVEAGWLVRVGAGAEDAVAATVDVRPYGGPDGEDWFIVSDLGCAVGGAGGIGSREEGSSSGSAAPPRPSRASRSVRPSPPPSISARGPASRRCTRHTTPPA